MRESAGIHTQKDSDLVRQDTTALTADKTSLTPEGYPQADA
jgi:hypothetical protein